MDHLVTLIVFLSFWYLSHQQGLERTLCRGDRSILAQCRGGRTPFLGQLPPGWGTTCQAGTTPCLLTRQSTVESTQYYNRYRCDSETNLNYLCLPGTGSYDIECGRLDHNGTESTGSAVSTTTTAVLTNKEFEATSIDNPSSTSSTAGSGDDGEGPQINVTGLTIGLTVALAVVVLVVLVIVVCCLLRKRRMTRDKPDNDVDPYSVTLRRNRKDKPPPDPDHESGRRREAEGRSHGDEGRDGSDTEAGSGGGEATGGDGVAVDPSDTCATVDRSRKDRDSADLTMQENNVYSSHSQPIENS